MSQIADLLLAAGAIGAGFYCFVLSRRLRRFTDLEKGVGGAVALLSAQVDDLTRALKGAQDGARQSRSQLTEQVRQAEETARRLELLVASVHDFAEPTRPAPARDPEPDIQSQEAAQFVRGAMAFAEHDR